MDRPLSEAEREAKTVGVGLEVEREVLFGRVALLVVLLVGGVAFVLTHNLKGDISQFERDTRSEDRRTEANDYSSPCNGSAI